jgi:microcystin-dependent protein
MASTLYNNAARIIKQVFDWMQTSQEGKTNNVIGDTFSSGINNATSSGEGFLIAPGTNNTSATPSVNCTGTSIAQDNLGNRIFIDISDVTLYNPANVTATTNDGLGAFISTPQSSGVVNISVGNSGTITYIWINYLATIDTSAFTLNKETNGKQFYKQTDGYNIQTVQVAYSLSPAPPVPPNANSIFLATVTMPTGPVAAVAPSNISQVGRNFYQILPNLVPITTPLANASDRTSTYAPASTYTLQAHIKSVGTGTGISPFNPHNMSLADLGVSQFDTVNAHRQIEHGINGSGPGSSTDVNNAIIAGVPGVFPASYPNTSAMACDIIIATSDYILVHQLLSTEFAIVNGSAYNVTSIFSAVPADAAVTFPTASGTYNVYWDSITQAFAVTTAAVANDATKLWLCTVTYTYVGILGHNALSALVERRRIGSTTERYQRWVTTARPPNPIPGEYGFNLDINSPEYYDGAPVSPSWQSLTVPTGAMLDFAGASSPSGFLLCDGSVKSQTDYPNLFTVISTIWNTGGEGAGNFRLPDFRRRVAVGSGGTGTGTLGNTVGNTGGAEDVTSTQNAHNHIQDAHTHISPVGGSPGVIVTGNAASWPYGTTNLTPDVIFVGAGSSGSASRPFLHDLPTTATNQSTTATNNPSSVIQKSAIVTKIIKI